MAWLNYKNRNIVIDSLRGLLLVIMLVDHIASPLDRFTLHSFGFFSAAEGFVFISGLVCGMTYSRSLVEKGKRFLQHQAVRRSLIIYSYHIVSLLLVLAGTYLKTGDFSVRRFFSAIVLVYRPPLFDLLPIYCVFLLAAPFVILNFHKNRAQRVFVTAVVLWFIGQLFESHRIFDYDILGLSRFSGFNILSWQVLFVSGLYFGYLTFSGRLDYSFLKNKGFMLVCCLQLVFFLVLRQPKLLTIFSDIDPTPFADKNTLGILRVINFSLLVYFITSCTIRFKELLEVRILAFLGQNSLQVFCFHLLAIYSLRSVIKMHDLDLLVQLAYSFAFVVTIYLPAVLNVVYNNRRYVWDRYKALQIFKPSIS